MVNQNTFVIARPLTTDSIATIFDRVIAFASKRRRHEGGTGQGSSSITNRGLEVIRLAATGASDKEIAATLGISLYTVESHWKRLRAQFGAPNRTGVIATVLLAGFNYERALLRIESQLQLNRIAELEAELASLREK